MGKIKYREEIEKIFKKTPIVSTRDIQMIISSLKRKFKLKEDYAYLLVHNLIKEGKIKRIVKGFYTIHEDPSLAVFCFKPAYIGLYDALSYHHLWEQATNTIILTTKKARAGTRRILGSTVIIHRLDKRFFFGFEPIKTNNFWIAVSDIEKTLIDLIYFKMPIDKKIKQEIFERLDKKKFRHYASRYPKKIMACLLNFLH